MHKAIRADVLKWDLKHDFYDEMPQISAARNAPKYVYLNRHIVKNENIVYTKRERDREEVRVFIIYVNFII